MKQKIIKILKIIGIIMLIILSAIGSIFLIVVFSKKKKIIDNQLVDKIKELKQELTNEVDIKDITDIDITNRERKYRESRKTKSD